MPVIRWAPAAADDLEHIHDFISADSVNYADLFVADVLELIAKLSQFPRLGRIVPEVDSPQIRELIKGNYRIVYSFEEDLVMILTIHHGARILHPKKLS